MSGGQSSIVAYFSPLVRIPKVTSNFTLCLESYPDQTRTRMWKSLVDAFGVIQTYIIPCPTYGTGWQMLCYFASTQLSLPGNLPNQEIICKTTYILPIVQSITSPIIKLFPESHLILFIQPNMYFSPNVSVLIFRVYIFSFV